VRKPSEPHDRSAPIKPRGAKPCCNGARPILSFALIDFPNVGRARAWQPVRGISQAGQTRNRRQALLPVESAHRQVLSVRSGHSCRQSRCQLCGRGWFTGRGVGRAALNGVAPSGPRARVVRQHSSARPWAGIRWSEARLKINRLFGMVMCSPPLRSRRRASFCRWQAWHCRARDAAVAPGRCPASIPETGRLAVELLSFG